MKLVYKDSKKEVKVGDHCKIFGNATVKITEIFDKTKLDSDGKVNVEFENGGEQLITPIVIKAEWVD